MKLKKVNRNFFWAETFVTQLYKLGIRNVCISPGSRSTPLALAFSKQKNISCFVHIDERVSGFFALGLAKATGKPTAVVTTSGTATAELYPAIIEAFMQRIPLIICTADRPPELIGKGANQTINQWNLYRNHIRYFKNVGLPVLTESSLNKLKKITVKAFEISLDKNRGPVHLNFPFRKPLEPGSLTDEVSEKIIKCKRTPISSSTKKVNDSSLSKSLSKQISKLAEQISSVEKGLLIVGPSNFNRQTVNQIIRVAQACGYPILADGLSQVRNHKSTSNKLIYSNYDAFLRSKNFNSTYNPEFVIHFGRTVTSPVLQRYLEESNADRFLINEFGDVFDPSGKSKSPIKTDVDVFCKALNEKLFETRLKRSNSTWLKSFAKAEKISSEIKSDHLKKNNFNFEPKIVSECFKIMSQNSNVMIGNSLPVRDLDNFEQDHQQNVKIFFNRGASGIDGITSTALGIAAIEKPVILFTGDLSFLHDLNALMPASKYSIPLVVILINNNGGGIFNQLPISKEEKSFEEFFKTPHNLNIGGIVKSFGLKHFVIKNEKNLKDKLAYAIIQKSVTVLEFKTDSAQSARLRKDYWTKVIRQIDKEFRAR